MNYLWQFLQPYNFTGQMAIGQDYSETMYGQISSLGGMFSSLCSLSLLQ